MPSLKLSMSDPNPPSPTPVAVPERLLLAELYPLCFNWEKPQPLKLRIHWDLVAAGYNLKAVRRALGAYCRRPSYQRALRVGATRLDLHGQPAGVVTEADVELARTSQVARAAAIRTSLSPNDTPLPKEYLVPGRLELTVKFSELPQPLSVQDGMKIGIQTGESIVTTILPPKVWRRLEQTVKAYPQWIAVLSGALGQHTDGEIALKHPTVQVFEKKAKPAVDSPAAAAGALAPAPAPASASALAPASAPAPAPALGYTKLTLKGRGTPKGS